MGSLIIHLYSYVSSTLVGWDNMIDMTWDMLKMLAQRRRRTTAQQQRGEHDENTSNQYWKPTTSFIEPFSLLMAFVGLIFLFLALIPGAQIQP